jgi:hypothetical protein
MRFRVYDLLWRGLGLRPVDVDALSDCELRFFVAYLAGAK